MKITIFITCTVLLFSCSHIDSKLITTENDSITEIIYPDCFSNIDTTGLDFGFGCGSIFLFKDLAEGLLTVSINPNDLEMNEQCRTFEISEVDVNLEIYPTEFAPENLVRTIDYCSCMKILNAEKRIKLAATKGSIITSVKSSENKILKGEFITAQLSNLEFYNHLTKEVIKIDNVIFWNVSIGWFAG